MVKLEMSKWFKPNDLKENEVVVTIAGEGEIRPKEETGFKNDTFELPVTLPGGETRVWTVNGTSQRSLITEFGDLTEKWVGKKITVFKRKQIVKGEDKDVLYARVSKKKANPKTGNWQKIEDA